MRPVRAIFATGGTRYECGSCGCSYPTEDEARDCEKSSHIQQTATAFTVSQGVSTTDHAAAAAEMLRRIVRELERNGSPEDLGYEVILIGRMMARRV